MRFRKKKVNGKFCIEMKFLNKWFLLSNLNFENERGRDLKISELRKGERFNKLKIAGNTLFSHHGNNVTCFKLIEV